MKNISISNKHRLLFIIGVIVFIGLLIIACLQLHKWILFHKYIDTADKFNDIYESIPEDMQDFADYCNSKGAGSFEIVNIYYSNDNAYIDVRDVDSIEEFNEVILVMSSFFSENPDYILNHRRLEISIRGNDFYIDCSWDTPSDALSEIRTFSFYIPEEVTEEGFIDVQRISIAYGESLSEDRIALLENIYPNAEIIFE